MSETTAKAGLRTEIATITTDPTVPQWTDMMRPTDEVLQNEGRGQGLKIYDEIERDPLANSVLQKRKLGLVARDWKLDPGGPRRQDKKAADLAERVLNGDWGLSFDKICLDLLDASLKGFAVAEIIWDVCDGFIVPAKIKPRNQRRFVFGLDGALRMLNRENSWTGIELPERKFIVHRFGDKLGDPYGRGLGHQLYWWCFFKRLGVQFWLTFAEKFGTPTVVGKVPNTMTDSEEDVLLEKLENIAQSAAMTIPTDAVVEFLEAARSGQVTYPDLVEYCDRMITVAVLGETLTTSEGNSGSRALGQVHQSVKDEIVDADADLLSATLNSQLLTWLTQLNFPDAVPPRVWRPRPSEEEAEAKLLQEQVKAADMILQHINSMRQAGYEPEDPQAPIKDQFAGKWNYTGTPTTIRSDGQVVVPEHDFPPAGGLLPLLGNEELRAWIARGRSVAPPQPDPALAALASPGNDQAGVRDLVEHVDLAAAGAMDALIGRVRSMLDRVETLEEAQAALVDLYPELAADDLALVIGRALTLANLTGRADIADGR